MPPKTRVLNVWLIRLSPALYELRSTVGPIKVLKSSIKKKKVPVEIYSESTGRLRKSVTEINLSQTCAIGGKLLAMVSAGKLFRFGVYLGSFPETDVLKLAEPHRTHALSASWRFKNL